MIDRLKNMFSKEKRIENLISLVIILVITLLAINRILNSESENTANRDFYNEDNVELASTNSYTEEELDNKIEKILNSIDGVSEVSVLITYTESSTLVPIYNIDSSISTSNEDSKISKVENVKKDVAYYQNSNNVITEKTVMPEIQGAIITAKGVSNPNIKTDVISAVSAVTGLSAYKIQVFERGGN